MRRHGRALLRAAVPTVVDAPAGVAPSVRFTGTPLVGQMDASDMEAVRAEMGEAPPGVAGWDIQHEWGRPWVDAAWSSCGFDVEVRRYLKAAAVGRTRVGERDDRRLELHHDPTGNLEPRDADDAEHITIRLQNARGWTMEVSAWLVHEVLVLRELAVHPAPKDTLALVVDPVREVRYHGPALTEFDLMYAMFGGRGYAWDPDAEPLEGWAANDRFTVGAAKEEGMKEMNAMLDADTGEVQQQSNKQGQKGKKRQPEQPDAEGQASSSCSKYDDPYHNRTESHALMKDDASIENPLGEDYNIPPDAPPKVDPEVEKAVQVAHARSALRRSVYRSLNQGHLIKQRKQRAVAHPTPPPTMRYRRSTAVAHEPFISLAPDASDTLYHFLDALGVNDPNLVRLSDVARYVGGLEAARQMHGVMHVLTQA
eukprot:TRINITY_DN26127_c0_g1_i1.p1 TRINITY_DN26127_c0_g1~~TRINITY_DN26127_c0_g1_i1.p1  ORF type:complete len:425 (+),score=128.31 TRINITY_DN26127_c0_g1_i1:41-1315(+)